MVLYYYYYKYHIIATSTKDNEKSNHECSAIVQTKTEISGLISKSSPRTIFSAALRVKTRSLPKVERTRYSNSNNQSLMKISNIQCAYHSKNQNIEGFIISYGEKACPYCPRPPMGDIYLTRFHITHLSLSILETII